MWRDSFNRPVLYFTEVVVFVLTASAPASPCIQTCRIGPQGWCEGCYRTLSEISGWMRLGVDTQWAVIRACETRRIEALKARQDAPL